MHAIYHLLLASAWQSADPKLYVASSLALEGFIHCSYSHQLVRVADKYFEVASDLVVLEIDPDRLGVEVKSEDIGTGELYPHVYGPIDRGAIVAVSRLTRDAAGCWYWRDRNLVP